MMRSPNIILITADSLRADRLGCYGYKRSTSPHLDRFAQHSTLFRHAYSEGPNTPHAFPTILAGEHALLSRRLGLFDSTITLAEVLRKRGYHTLGFNAANPYLSRFFSYDRGFDVFDDFLHDDLQQELQTLCTERRRLEMEGGRGIALPQLDLKSYLITEESIHNKAVLEAQMNTRVTDGLKQLTGQPFFLWLHYMDCHFPYLPQLVPQTELGLQPVMRDDNLRLNRLVRENSALSTEDLETVNALYDATIRQLDSKLAEIFSLLGEMGCYEQSVIAFTADHGEEFGEHGDLHHKSKLFDELLHVPLLLKLPDQAHPVTENRVVSLRQLMPTLLKLAGISVAGVQTLFDRPASDCAAFAAASYGPDRGVPTDADMFRTDCMPKVYALRDRQWKLIYDTASSSFRLFKLLDDPEERRDLWHELEGTHPLQPELMATVARLERNRLGRQITRLRNHLEPHLR